MINTNNGQSRGGDGMIYRIYNVHTCPANVRSIIPTPSEVTERSIKILLRFVRERAINTNNAKRSAKDGVINTPTNNVCDAAE